MRYNVFVDDEHLKNILCKLLLKTWSKNGWTSNIDWYNSRTCIILLWLL